MGELKSTDRVMIVRILARAWGSASADGLAASFGSRRAGSESDRIA